MSDVYNIKLNYDEKAKKYPRFYKNMVFLFFEIKIFKFIGRTFLNFKKILVWAIKLIKFKNVNREFR